MAKSNSNKSTKTGKGKSLTTPKVSTTVRKSGGSELAKSVK